jgi:hypothetical protein
MLIEIDPQSQPEAPPLAERSVGRVMVMCPGDGKPVHTGQRMTRRNLAAVSAGMAFRCERCNVIHRWGAGDAWLEPPRA